MKFQADQTLSPTGKQKHDLYKFCGSEFMEEV